MRDSIKRLGSKFRVPSSTSPPPDLEPFDGDGVRGRLLNSELGTVLLERRKDNAGD